MDGENSAANQSSLPLPTPFQTEAEAQPAPGSATNDDVPPAPEQASRAPSAHEGGEGGEGGDAAPSSPPPAALTDADGAALPPASVGDDIYHPAPSANPVLDALLREGLYGHALETSGHRITCPWQAEHAADEQAPAFYSGPSETVPLGTFHCSCTHKEQRTISGLISHLKVDRREARCKPMIRIKQGELHRVVVAAEKVLADRGGFYRSSGQIVTLATDPTTGDTKIEALNDQSLSMKLSAACDWEKYDGRAEDWRKTDVPLPVVKGLLNSPGMRALPELNAIARQPYLRRTDRVLVNVPGYDAASGTFAAFDPAAFVIPELTRENALSALQRLQSLLVEFEFASPSDQAATLAAMLTASIRDFLPVAPGFNITASSPGSGKSYLATVLSQFAGPGDARSISYPSTQEEATKVVLSLALEQPAAVCFDDMPGDWKPHGAMNRMMTSGTITERRLGSNTVVTARACSFIMGTGNNIRPLRDLARRIVSIYLLPQVETAATREFQGDPAAEVRRNRSRYVSDALTIIAAFQAAGCPQANVPNVAGFDVWSELCRHSLIWLGQSDPAASLIEQIAHDPDREQFGDLLHAWRDAFGQKPTLVRQVIKRIENDKGGDLHSAIMELPCVERGFVNQSSFGRYLGRHKNQIVNGWRLIEASHSERRAWAVVPAGQHAIIQSPSDPADPLAGIERTWLDAAAARGKSLPTV